MKLKILFLLLIAATVPSVNASQWFVNINTGDDSYDGTSPFVAGMTGPKKTIANAISTAMPYDTLYISDGLYEENIVVDKPLVIRGNNWGINPLTQLRNAETIVTTMNVNLGTTITGNTIIEITSCCVEIDGLQIQGDNPNILNSTTKYGEEYDISYCVAGSGTNLSNLHLTNLIISNFAYSGIYLSAGTFSTQANRIDNCKINTGEQNSEAIVLIDNFYCDVNFITIDSVYKGLSLNNFSDKNSETYTISYLNIHSEMSGITLNNFNGNTDSLLLENNILNPFDLNIDFTGFVLTDILADGYASISNNIINDAYTGISIKNFFDLFKTNITNNAITRGKLGIAIEQSIITPIVNITVNNSVFKDLDSAAVLMVADGGTLTVNLSDVTIDNNNHGVILMGNSNLTPGNTQFNTIKGYYIFLDSSSTGLKPSNTIDATTCYYESTIGNSLNKSEAFAVEDKIRHVLDRKSMAWVLFKNQNLYVTNRDGNNSVSQAHAIASNNWNIYLDSISRNERVIMFKTIHLYPHSASQIGKIRMDGIGETLYIHGKLVLTEGLELVQGIIETSPFDTLVVYRSYINTVLNPGNTNSFVRGPLYLRYINLPTSYIITDTIPIGISSDFRPLYINATWPSGLLYFDIGFKTFYGSAPISTLPTGVTHISDLRYWQITNPHNQSSFDFNNVGVLYDTVTINDLVNDPNNLRMVYRDNTNSFNLGGSGNTPDKGSIISTTGTPGFGFYALGNGTGGNNILSMDNPIAAIVSFGHCANDTITLSGMNSRSDSAIVQYEWEIKGPSTVLTPQTTQTIRKNIPVAGTYTVTLIVTNTKGFTDTATHTLIIDALPTMSYSSKSPCFPLPIEVKNTSTIPPFTTISSTEWTIDTFLITTPDLNYSPTLAGLQNGLLKVTLSNGCFDSIPFSVLSPAAPTIKLVPNGLVEICDGDSVVVKVIKNGGLLSWNDGLTHDSLILKSSTFKKVTITASSQCFRSDSVSSTILPVPTVEAGPDFTVLPGKPVSLKGEADAMVEWLPDMWLNDAIILNPVSRPLITTKYFLRAYNVLGCVAYDSMTVFVNDENTSNVPNLLTPNGDGHNDTWVLSNIPDGEKCNVNVFTREGQLVFSADNYNHEWDGTRDTKPLPDGYYVFVVENKSTGKVQTGILNIIK